MPYGLYLWSFMLHSVLLHNFNYNEKHLSCRILPPSLSLSVSLSRSTVQSSMLDTVCPHVWCTMMDWLRMCINGCICILEWEGVWVCCRGRLVLMCAVYVWGCLCIFWFSGGLRVRPSSAPSSSAQAPAGRLSIPWNTLHHSAWLPQPHRHLIPTHILLLLMHTHTYIHAHGHSQSQWVFPFANLCVM